MRHSSHLPQEGPLWAVGKRGGKPGERSRALGPGVSAAASSRSGDPESWAGEAQEGMSVVEVGVTVPAWLLVFPLWGWLGWPGVGGPSLMWGPHTRATRGWATKALVTRQNGAPLPGL